MGHPDTPNDVIEKGLESIPDDVLGAKLKEYVRESNHESDVWRGFRRDDMRGTKLFLSDLIEYIKADG